MSNTSSTNLLFKYFHALKEGEAWKHFQDSLNVKAELPEHMVKAHFTHLWKQDEDFRTKTLTSLSEISIDIMSAVKDLSDNKPKSKKVYVTGKSLGQKSNGISAKVIDAMSDTEEMSTNEVSIATLGSKEKATKKKIYMSLYFLEQKGVVKKINRNNESFWILINKPSEDAPILKKITPGRRQRKIGKVKNRAAVRARVGDIIKGGGVFTTSQIAKIIDDEGLFESSDTKKVKNTTIHNQLSTLLSKDIVRKEISKSDNTTLNWTAK